MVFMASTGIRILFACSLTIWKVSVITKFCKGFSDYTNKLNMKKYFVGNKSAKAKSKCLIIHISLINLYIV